MKFIKLLILVLILGTGLSCSETQNPVKPFIVKDKRTSHNPVSVTLGMCRYTYFDKNGNEFSFEDRIDKYEVGDTLK